MQNQDKSSKMRHFYLIIIITILSGFAIHGAPWVPFHPDESTYLYMSSDFDLLIKQPTSLAFDPKISYDPRQRYRLIDPPITRYFLGLVRNLSKQEALKSDWDWSSDWEENQATGAFPPSALLHSARLANSLLYPVCLYLTFLIGKRLGGFDTGLVAMLLFGLNALVLLHNRRLMAESWLTLGILLTLWGIFNIKQKPWLVGIGISVAINAKHSAILLLPVVIFAGFLPLVQDKIQLRKLLLNLAIILLILLIVTAILNPVFWNMPIKALEAAWKTRTELVHQQVLDAGLTQNVSLMQQTLQNLGSLLANLYLRPPAFYEVGNYSANTAIAQERYLETAGHHLLRNPLGAGFSLFLTLLGLIRSLKNYSLLSSVQKADYVFFWLAGFSLFLGTLIMVPLPWQRYVIPLVPFTCLWMAYGLTKSNWLIRQNNSPSFQYSKN